jgi:hypothetical protein
LLCHPVPSFLMLQVTVIELYDATPRDLSIEAIILGRTQHAARVSSYTALQLEVLSQSFFLQHAITGMSVSQTLQGITTKQLLLHTQHDQVRARNQCCSGGCTHMPGRGTVCRGGRSANHGIGPGRLLDVQHSLVSFCSGVESSCSCFGLCRTTTVPFHTPFASQTQPHQRVFPPHRNCSMSLILVPTHLTCPTSHLCA